MLKKSCSEFRVIYETKTYGLRIPTSFCDADKAAVPTNLHFPRESWYLRTVLEVVFASLTALVRVP